MNKELRKKTPPFFILHSLFPHEEGQTLIEVVAGIGLLVIVVTALIGLGVIALKTSSSARNRTVAAKLANEGMEIARSVRDQGTLDDVSITNPTLSGDSVTVGSVTFSRAWEITGSVAKKTIKVTVSWPESSGTKSVSVTSYLTDWR